MLRKITSLFFVAFVIFASGIFACVQTNAPWEKPNVEWFSNEPVLSFSSSEFCDSEGTIVTESGIIPIQMLWSPTNKFVIVDATKDDEPLESKTLLRGKVQYDNESAILIVRQDNIFNGRYQTIKLFYREIQE